MCLPIENFATLEQYMDARSARWNAETIDCCRCGKTMPVEEANGDLGGNPLCEPCVDAVLAECERDLAEPIR